MRHDKLFRLVVDVEHRRGNCGVSQYLWRSATFPPLRIKSVPKLWRKRCQYTFPKPKFLLNAVRSLSAFLCRTWVPVRVPKM